MGSKISVIVPVYKVEPYIHRCIDSIINQSYKNLEIILVNDGSPDNSGVICDEYAVKDNRIIVLHKENKGSSCARNAGLDIASGEYIAYVDSDDHIDRSMLEIMMGYMLKNDLEVVEIEPVTSNTNKIFNNEFKIEDPVTATKRILANSSFSVWRRVFKRSLVNDMRFIPGIIHQDVFYTMDVLKKISRIGYLNSPLYFYNTENESIIRNKYSLKKIKTGIRATEYIVNNALDNPQIKESINDYVTGYYTDHYFLLSRNTSIDLDKSYRNKLKKEIVKSISFGNITFRTLLIIILPGKIIEFVSSSYQYIKSRIS